MREAYHAEGFSRKTLFYGRNRRSEPPAVAGGHEQNKKGGPGPASLSQQ
jgi:hypothetical protein